MTVIEEMFKNDLIYVALRNANDFAHCPLYEDALNQRYLEIVTAFSEDSSNS